MRPREPRVTPLEESEWSAEQREVMAPMLQHGTVYNIFKTLLRHPKLLKRWLPFANHILFKSSLPPRERELVILRVGWLCRAEYEWAQHVEIGRRAGLGEADFARLREGPAAAGWTPAETDLLSAVDELHGDACIADETWQRLSRQYSTEQLLDLVFTVGNYTLVSMALNTLGVRLDPGLRGFGEHGPSHSRQ